ncbi:MAG: DNA-formamidopyrimidine glycosylase [Thermomicrobiales bacterium]
MPELPEVETVCRTLREPLVGRRIESVEVFWPRTVEPTPVAEFISEVPGNGITRVDRRAKLIVFELSGGGVLTTHLRMTGQLLYRPAEAVKAAGRGNHLRVTFELDNGARLDFIDTRKFGRIRLLSLEDWEARSAEFGPEPLEAEFDPETFYSMLRSVNRQIKPLLLDQTFIAGIGNIYADEALYAARIHPQKISSSISKKKARLLHDAIVDTLSSAIENAGTTFRDYRSGLGESGTNQSRLLVYGAAPGTECARCGTPLRRIVVGQRGSTICPRCQRLN